MKGNLSSSLQREHIATYCVCCGNLNLKKSPAILMPFVSHRALGWEPVVVDYSWGLTTIPEGLVYCICNTMYCALCNFLFLDIRFSESEMSCLYDGYLGEEYEYLREKYEPGFRLRNKTLVATDETLYLARNFISQYVYPKTILDWGGGDGRNTPFIGDGYQVSVYDIGGGAVVGGVERVEKEVAFKSEYDLVVCRHVLEHIPFPSDMLDEIRECMREDTILYIEVPHEPIMTEERVFPDKKRHWHEHINFFSIDAMRKLLSSCGYEVLQIVSEALPSNRRMTSFSRVLQVVAKKL